MAKHSNVCGRETKLPIGQRSTTSHQRSEGWEDKTNVRGRAMTNNPFSPLPAYHRSVVRLSCSACGAEANASCSCGKPYVPISQRVAEYDKANPGKSSRDAGAALGLSHTAVQEARRSPGNQFPPETVTGRDNKTYPAKKPKLPSYIPAYQDEPNQDEDLIDQIETLFRQLTRQGQSRCGVLLDRIVRGEA
jgi:hypothetical protein